MKAFAATYTDVIKFDRKPNEDFYLISKKYPIFVVADGVTQSHFEYNGYAFPAGAKAAAEIFCYSALEFLEKNLKTTKDRKALIKRAFNFANERVRELNKNEGILERLDYYIYDYFDCVGIAGFIFENKLFYGYVGDCGLVIFNKNNKLRFQTKDQVIKAEKYLEKISKERNFNKKEKEIFWRKELRNHPSGSWYGTFSGQEGVKKYYVIDSQPIQKGDLIVFYSDGFREYLKFPEFIKILRRQDKKSLDDFIKQKAKENYEKFGTDRTLVAVIPNS